MVSYSDPTRFPATICLSLADPTVARHFHMLTQNQLSWKESGDCTGSRAYPISAIASNYSELSRRLLPFFSSRIVSGEIANGDE